MSPEWRRGITFQLLRSIRRPPAASSARPAVCASASASKAVEDVREAPRGRRSSRTSASEEGDAPEPATRARRKRPVAARIGHAAGEAYLPHFAELHAGGECVVIGVDPGYATVGFGVLRARLPPPGLPSGGPFPHAEVALVRCGAIRTASTESMSARIMHIHAELAGLLAAEGPAVVAMERIWAKVNSNAVELGQARGVLVLAVAQSGAPLVEYEPTTVKKEVTGSGTSGKGEVGEAVRAALGLEAAPRPDDAVDAIAIALTALAHAARLRPAP